MRGLPVSHAAELVEREGVLAEIGEHIRSAAAGRGGTLLIEAAPGLGKTSVLAEAARLGGEQGVTACRAQGGELEQSFAWGIARQLLIDLVRVRPTEVPVAARSPLGISTGTAEDPLAVAYALTELCNDLAGDGPLTLMVDDAHWCDRPSAVWLSYLAPRVRAMPVALLVAARPLDRRRPPELTTLAGRDGVQLQKLTPLSAAGMARIVRRSVPDATDDLCDGCGSAAGGNPFLLSELLRELSHRPDREPIDVADVPITRIDQVIHRRLLAAGRQAERLARALGVFGTKSTLADVAAVAGLDSKQARGAVDALCAGGITGDTVDGWITFTHPLIHAGVRRLLGAGEQTALHLQAARRLASQDEPVEQVAMHLLVMEPGAEPWVRDQLIRAGDAAIDAGAPRNAVALYQRAAAERVGAPDPRLLAKLGRAALRFDPTMAEKPLRLALAATPEPIQQVPLALDLAVVLQTLRRPGETVPLLEKLESALREINAPRGIRLRVEAELLAQSFFSPKTTHLRRARLPMLTGTLTGADDEEALIRVQQAIEAINTGTAVEARVLADRAWSDGRLQRLAGSLVSPAVMWVPYVRLYVDDYDWTIGVAREWLEHARLGGSPVLSVFANAMLAEAQSRAGALRDAHASGVTAWQIAQEIGPQFPGWSMAIGVLAEALLAVGRPQDAAELLRGEGLLDGPPPDTMLMPAPRAVRGEVLIASGALTAGVDELLETDRWVQRRNEPSPGGWRFYTPLVDGLLALGQRDRAGDVARAWLRRTKRFGAPAALGAAERAVALTRTGDAQLEGLRQAERTVSRSPARAEHARTLLELGAALRRGRQRAAAREPLRRALDLATRCGAEALAERATVELRATGARPRKAILTGADALTPSERRVAELASSGLTNREIAATLFISRKTVESHLASSYRKLETNDRSQLAELLTPTPR